jgi:hypothetical protein
MEWTFPRHLAPSGSASCAICSCFVDTPIFGSVSAHLACPTHSFLSPTSPFPTRWLPRVGSPLFLRYYEDAKTSGCSSPRSSFSCERGYLLDSSSFARLGLLESLPLRLGVDRPVSPLAPVFFLSWRKSVGSLKFPGYPFVLLPCS